MNRMWPFNLFPSMKDDDTSNREELMQVEPVETELDDDVDTGEDPEVPDDETVEENLPEEDVDDDDVVIEDDIITEEEMPNDEISDDDEEVNLPDLEEELEIALAKAHQEEVEKNRARTKVVIGLAILGAAGLATGFGIRSYIKKRKN